jgi:hypothetical protein
MSSESPDSTCSNGARCCALLQSSQVSLIAVAEAEGDVARALGPREHLNSAHAKGKPKTDHPIADSDHPVDNLAGGHQDATGPEVESLPHSKRGRYG